MKTGKGGNEAERLKQKAEMGKELKIEDERWKIENRETGTFLN